MANTTKKKVSKKKASRKVADPAISNASTTEGADQSSSDVVKDQQSLGDTASSAADAGNAKTSPAQTPSSSAASPSSSSATPPSSPSEQTPSNPTTGEKTVTNNTTHSPKKSGSALAVISLLFSLLALAAVAYTWYDAQVKQVNAASKLVNDVAAVGSQVTVLGDRVESLQSERDKLVSSDQLELRVNQLQSQTSAEFSQLSTAQADVVERMASLQDALTQGTEDFILDDVGQLLKSANVSVLVLGNREGGLKALQIAEQQLQDLGDPRFTSVRQSILSDIAALQAVEVVDMDKVSITIQNLVAQIQDLDLVNEPVETSLDRLSLAGSDAQEVTGFKAGLREMGRDFLSLFTIKIQRVDQPATPLLAPDQRYFLDLNLSLALNKAELAALQNRPVIFKQSIAEAKQWLLAYFDGDTPKVSAFLAELTALEDTQLDVELPSVAEGYAEFILVRGQR